MNDVVWVALVSAGGVMGAAIAAQLLAARVASRSADRTDQREALQWQRSEARRLEDVQRQDAQAALAWERADMQRKQDVHDARLRELWGHVLVARWQMLDALERVPVQGSRKPKSADVSAVVLPSTAAAQAYAVALIGTAAVRPSARAFYLATSQLQLALQSDDGEQMKDLASEWSASYKALEDAVGDLAAASSN